MAVLGLEVQHTGSLSVGCGLWYLQVGLGFQSAGLLSWVQHPFESLNEGGQASPSPLLVWYWFTVCQGTRNWTAMVSGFLDCLEATLCGSHSRVNPGATCALAACCLPVPGAMLAGTPPAGPVCASYPRESFSKTTDVACASVDAVCASWGPSRWENWAMSLSRKAFGKSSLTTLSHVLLPWDQCAWKAVLCCLFTDLVEVMMLLNFTSSFHLAPAPCFPISRMGCDSTWLRQSV